jgi:nitrogen-specific signal transduction histidine kinase
MLTTRSEARRDGEETENQDPEAARTVRDLLHDIRNSISVVLAHAHLLASRPWIGSGVEAIRTICQESYRIATLLSLLPGDLAEVRIDGRGASTRPTRELGSDRR